METNKYKSQEYFNDDNLVQDMPFHIYRVTWKDTHDNYFEFWSEKYTSAWDKKFEIDHSEEFEYLNFESWFAFRSDFYEKKLKHIIPK